MTRLAVRRLLPALALLAIPVAGRPMASGDDAKTYSLLRKSVWHVGDVVTTTIHEAETKTTEQTPPGGTAEAGVQTETKTDAVTVWRCLAAGDDGAWTKMLVYMKSWSRDQAPRHDESLKGARIEVAGQGRSASWKIVSDGLAPSREASDWLDKRYGAKSTDEGALLQSLAPKEPVAVGAEWAGDPAPMFGAGSLAAAADLSKSSVKARLKAADATSLRLGFEISLSLKTVPGLRPGMQSSWTQGGNYRLTGDVMIGVEGSPVVTSISQQGHLDGDASITTPAGPLLLSVNLSAFVDVRIVKGGEIPDAPAPAAPAEPKKDDGGGEPTPK